MIQCFAKQNWKQSENNRESIKLRYACFSNEDEPVRALHCHKDIFEFILITKGSGKVFVADHSYNVAPGSMVLVNAGELHKEQSNTEEPLVRLCLGIAGIKEKNNNDNQLISEGLIPVYNLKNNFELYKKLFELCYNQLYYDLADAAKICDSTAHTVLQLVRQDVGEGIKREEKSDYIAKRARKYVEENYQENITLDIVAQQLNISRYYLSRQFNKSLGYSFNGYLNQLRIGEAQNLLIHTDYSVAMVGQIVGIDNASYFNSVFHRVVGTQPTRYRQSFRRS